MTPEPDVQALTQHELSSVFHTMLRFRAVTGPTIMAACALWVGLDGGALWQVAVPTSVALTLLLLSASDLKLSAEQLGVAKVARILLSVLFAMGTLVAFTGGLGSPFVIVIPTVLFLAAIVIGRARVWMGVYVPVVVAAWTLVAADLAGLAPNNASVLAEVAVAIIVSLAGAVGGVIGITLRRAIERAVLGAARARTEVMASMRERNDELFALSSTLAHELKNPLASIQGLATLQARRLEEGSRDAERMGVLLSEVKRMGQILEEFLNFSRPVGALSVVEIQPHELLAEVVDVHVDMATQRGVELSNQAEHVVPIRADPRKLKQVLVNLVQNAIDACAPAGGQVVTRVHTRDDLTLFEVIDEGPGLDAHLDADLFKAGVTTKPSGSGLGLTIARTIVEQHGGQLTLTTRQGGGGSVATVALPIAREVDP